MCEGGGQAGRSISTARLNTLPCLYLRPIHVVVSDGPSGSPHLERGFPLRCFQRFSAPMIATRHCTWRHNRHTSASSSSVLSY